MSTAKMTSRGQITIPADVREELGLHPGTEVEFCKGNNGDYVIRVRKGSIKELKGLLKKLGYVPDGPAPTIEEMDEAIGRQVYESDLATRSKAQPDPNEDAA